MGLPLFRTGAALAAVFSLQIGLVMAQSPPCASHFLIRNLDKRVGSSSFFGNLLGSKESIKSQLKSMFGDAKGVLRESAPTDLICPDGCTLASEPELLFSASPQSYLQDHPELERCTQHLEATTRDPIAYPNRVFESFKELSDAFLDIAKGSGVDGEDLYERCDGDCSPRYSLYITGAKGETVDQENFRSDILVVCGPPRDKSENLYDLGTQLIWKCENR
jgi:hypothetical protein